MDQETVIYCSRVLPRAMRIFELLQGGVTEAAGFTDSANSGQYQLTKPLILKFVFRIVRQPTEGLSTTK